MLAHQARSIRYAPAVPIRLVFSSPSRDARRSLAKCIALLSLSLSLTASLMVERVDSMGMPGRPLEMVSIGIGNVVNSLRVQYIFMTHFLFRYSM